MSIVCVSLPVGSPVFSRHPETEITSVTSFVPAGATICSEGIKESILTETTFSCGTLMLKGTLNLCLTGCSFVNSSALKKGTASVDGNSSIADVPSHLDMEPENLFCILRSVALGMEGVSPLRKVLPALAAIPKFADLIFVAADCFTCNGLDRAHCVPMRR